MKISLFQDLLPFNFLISRFFIPKHHNYCKSIPTTLRNVAIFLKGIRMILQKNLRITRSVRFEQLLDWRYVDGNRILWGYSNYEIIDVKIVKKFGIEVKFMEEIKRN